MSNDQKKHSVKTHHKKSAPKPETTGHNWDGIEEYNTPAPRWWLIVWLVSIIWAIIYWFFYPTWPTFKGNTQGLKNWSQYGQLQQSQSDSKAAGEAQMKKFAAASFDEIKNNPELIEFAIAGGKSAFKQNCAACHGTGAAGSKGFPNLNDDDWLWGGKIEDIYQTLLFGIRSGHEKARTSQMPSFGVDKILTKEEITATANYVLSLSGKGQFNKKGEEIFAANCAACHTISGKGNRQFGAPNLTDAIWLYGSDIKDVTHTIFYARAGVMPAWSTKLDNNTIKQLSVYVYFLGGGEK